MPLEDKAVKHTKTEIFCIEKNSPCSTAGLKNISSFSVGTVSVAEKHYYQEVEFLLQMLEAMKLQHHQEKCYYNVVLDLRIIQTSKRN